MNLSNEHVEEDLSKVNMLNEYVKVDLLKVNFSATSWIIPPSLRNNGIHCVFIQVRIIVGYFNSRVPFSLCGEMSSFIHLKKGDGFHPCMGYVSSLNGVAKNQFQNIWMDVFDLCYLQVTMFQEWCMLWSK